MFTTHLLRKTSSLNGVWQFRYLGAMDPETFVPEFEDFSDRMLVPGAFDASPLYAGLRGVAAYRTQIEIPPGHPARVHFGAVSMWTRIFVDGVAVRDHACGYAPFWVEIPPSKTVLRELVVLVDNRFDFVRAPMHEPYFDFYQYGGIIRDVTLHILPENGDAIERVEVTPSVGYRNGDVQVRVFLSGNTNGTVDLTTQFDHDETIDHPDTPVIHGYASLTLRVPHPKLWSPEEPNLHYLRVTASQHDDLQVRFGLRTIESQGSAILLNGKPIRLLGYNRHEWHPSCGPSTSPQQMAADLQHLRALGCNFVRGAHYPQDQRFLDLCDEFGILVWEENLGWQQNMRSLTDATYRIHHAETMKSMVGASYNHPSVIIWGFLNEADSDQAYSDAIFHESLAQLRALDASRLISYASHRPDHDRHFGLVDIIAVNVYPGWYNCVDVDEPLALIGPGIKQLFDTIDARGWADKPLIVSEIGAEALYGCHDPHGDFFSEEYQAALLASAIQETLGNPRCSGIVLWQFCDTRSYGGGRSLSRPRTFNNKGTLDEYRRPKLAYWKVRALFQFYANSSSENHEQNGFSQAMKTASRDLNGTDRPSSCRKLGRSFTRLTP